MTEDFVLQLLKNMNIDKAAGIDNLSGKFLKDGTNTLLKPISEVGNLSIKYSLFPTGCRITKLKGDSWPNTNIFRWKQDTL